MDMNSSMYFIEKPKKKKRELALAFSSRGLIRSLVSRMTDDREERGGKGRGGVGWGELKQR